MALCPCGSSKPYETCCGPLHRGERTASSPLELMKSRYSAYALGNGRYLVDTAASEYRHEEDAELIEEHARHTEWLGLEIVAHDESGDEGTVEFKAIYREYGTVRILHEKSLFVRRDGRWYYTQGTLYDAKPGRNDPCPCGSGKKYKKCCGSGAR